jgi:hypothetical protein
VSSIEPYGGRDVARTGSGDVTPAHCKNCGAALLGRFCVDCSQAADVHVPTTKELAHELLEGLTHSDSRLWRTLTTLWFKPGKLTEEFVAGRRVAYLPPFRLYLIVSVLFFLTASFMPANFTVLNFDDATKPAAPPASASTSKSSNGQKTINSCQDIDWKFADHPTWNPRIKQACEGMLRDNGADFLHVAISTMSKAMFLFLPLIAFLHMLMYWRPRYRYAEQLLFFVHLQAFYFSIALLMVTFGDAAGAWPKLAGVVGGLETLLGWSLPIYTVLAMRRVFRRSWAGTLFKGVLLFFVYTIVFGLTVAGVVVYSAFQL